MTCTPRQLSFFEATAAFQVHPAAIVGVQLKCVAAGVQQQIATPLGSELIGKGEARPRILGCLTNSFGSRLAAGLVIHGGIYTGLVRRAEGEILEATTCSERVFKASFRALIEGVEGGQEPRLESPLLQGVDGVPAHKELGLFRFSSGSRHNSASGTTSPPQSIMLRTPCQQLSHTWRRSRRHRRNCTSPRSGEPYT